MFDTPPALHTGVPQTRAIMAALLLHVLLIAAAVHSTASPRAGSRPIARDTIRLEMADVVATSRPEPVESPRSRPDAVIPESPRVPDIPINAPEFQLPRLSFTILGRPETSRPYRHPSPGKSRVSLDSSLTGFSTAEVDELPVLVEELQPRYPDGLRRAGVSGLVRLQYVVGTDGRIDERSIRVLSSSHPGFLLAALQALHEARFKPARRGGRPEAVLVEQAVSFRYR